MKNEAIDPNYRCPVTVTLDIIGGKWKAVILWHLTFKTLRFSQLRRRLPEITQKMLTQQLRELENDGMVNRKVYAEVPPRVEYSLTESGMSLQPILAQMCDWGREHLEQQEIDVPDSCNLLHAESR
ncbi:MAG: transcriptional regulator [Desulfuromonas sp.]|nr:MAG: transcriptional regulator [Desulfuromonas sp.]